MLWSIHRSEKHSRYAVLRFLVALMLMFTSSPMPTYGQTEAGILEGVVEDQAGARVPGATIQAVSASTSQKSRTVSDSEGNYRLAGLPFGSYRIEVSLTGFTAKSFETVQIEPGSPTKLNITLSTSGVSESVNVTSDSQLIQTENSTQATTLTQKELVSLPTASRNITHLIVAEPGVTAPLPDRTGAGLNIATTPGSQEQDSGMSLNPSVNGARPTNNSLRLNGLDGTNLLNRFGGLSNNLIVPLDALEVVSVQSALYTSPTGRNGGGNIELITKSGGNQFHGSVQHFLQNEKFNANEFFLNRNGNKRPEFRRNETSATFGGPILRDKLFFFASAQRTDFVSGYASNATARVGLPIGLTDVRTQASIADVANLYLANGVADHADFAKNFLAKLRTYPADQQPGLLQKFFGTTTPGNNPAFRRLTAADIHQVAINILNQQRGGRFLIPSPASELAILKGNGTFGREAFLQQVIPTEVKSWAGVGSLLYTPSVKDRFRLNYNYSDSEVTEAFGWADASPSPTDGETFGFATSLSHQHTFTDRLLNDFRVGFFDLSNNRLSRFQEIKNSTLGIYNPLEFALGGLAALMPTIDINTQHNSGGIGNAWDFFDRQKVMNLIDTMSWMRGRHALQFGGEYRRMNLTGEFMSRTNGDLDYDNWVLFFTGNGNPTGGSDLDQGDTRRNMTAQDVSWYFHDDWKIRRNLTFNLGLRYDFFGHFVDKDGRLATYITEAMSKETGLPVGYQVPANSPVFKPGFKPIDIGLYVEPGVEIDLSQLHKSDTHSTLFNDYNNFAPRLGFAWNPEKLQQLVLRGGYSIFFERTSASYKVDLQRAAPFFIFQNVPAPLDMANPYPRLNINPFELPVNVAIVRNANGAPRWVRGDGREFPATEPFSSKSNVFIHPRIRAPYMQQWSLNLQYQLANGIAFDTRYVGSRGVGLVGRVNLAQALDPRLTPVNDFTDIRTKTGALINPDFFVPTEFLGLNRSTGFALVSNIGHSTYHALQVDFKGRMRNRAIWNLAYTWSKSIDNMSSDTDVAEHDGRRLDNNRGVSNFDRTHRFTASYVLDLPSLPRGHRVLKGLTSGWRFSGLATMQSGSPFSVLGNPATNAFFAQVARVRVDFAPGQTIASATKSGRVQDRLNQFFNPLAFQNSGDQWGNSGRNILRGPRQTQFDVALGKMTKLSETVNLEFRWEMFNAFNTPIFANPNSTFPATGIGTVGQITSTVGGPRTMQASLKLAF
jgi:hypothetical protein